MVPVEGVEPTPLKAEAYETSERPSAQYRDIWGESGTRTLTSSFTVNRATITLLTPS